MAYHHLQNHCGASGLYSLLKKTKYWPNMETDIKKFCSACVLCQIYRAPANPQLPLGSQEWIPSIKGFAFSMDIIEGFANSHPYIGKILHIAEHISRFHILRPLKTAEAPEIAEILENYVLSVYL